MPGGDSWRPGLERIATDGQFSTPEISLYLHRYSSRSCSPFPGSEKTPGNSVARGTVWPGVVLGSNQVEKIKPDEIDAETSKPAEVGGDDADTLAQTESLDHLLGRRHGHAPPRGDADAR